MMSRPARLIIVKPRHMLDHMNAKSRSQRLSLYTTNWSPLLIPSFT